MNGYKNEARDVESRINRKKAEQLRRASEGDKFRSQNYLFDPNNPPRMMFMAGALTWRLNPWAQPKESRTFLLTLSFKNPVSIDLIEKKIKEAFGGME